MAKGKIFLLNFLATFIFTLLLISQSSAQNCPDTVNIQINDDKNTTVRFQFLGVTGTTWEYQITEISGRSLSHGNLIDTCLDFIVDSDPLGEIGQDGSTGYSGIKWDVDEDFTSETFAITLDDYYPISIIEVLVKAGNTFALGEICGPACDPVLIELSSFTAMANSGKVILAWSTESEIDNAGFNLYRSEAEDGKYVKVNNSLIPADGSPTEGVSYKFVDEGVENRKTYYYMLEDIDLNSISTMHGPVSATPRFIYGIIK